MNSGHCAGTDRMKRETFMTLVTNEEYCIGALVLAVSLRQVQTQKELSVLVTSEVPSSMRNLLLKHYDNVIEVNAIYNTDKESLNMLSRKELTISFTKIHCWSMVQFDKIVFLDADTMVLHNIDELFEREELSAVPDPNWPDCFNAGVFVLKPCMDTFNGLLRIASCTGSFDGRDQGLLNTYFTDWLTKGISHRLAYIYNCICQIHDEFGFDFYTSTAAWVQFGGTIRVAHFSGPIKPWHRVSSAKSCSREACLALLDARSERRMVTRTAGMLAYWWSLFLILVRPDLTPDMPGVAGHLGRTDFGNKLCARHERMETERMYAWERGEIDYTGTDRFANILAKLCDTMTRVGGEGNRPIGLDV